MRRLSLVPFFFALATSACAHAPEALDGHARSPEAPKPPHSDPGPDPRKSAPVDARFAASSNALAADLYEKLATGTGNLAFSPASIETAFTMTWAGAKGETDAQMRRALHLGEDRDAALAAATSALASYAKPHKGYELLFADKLFGERSYPFAADFVKLSKDAFGAPLETVDFLGQPDASRRAINAFVGTSTKDRIKDLLPEGAIDETTRLVLVNAVYMKGKWVTAFPKAGTSPEPFASPGGKKDVPTMHTQGSFAYGEADGALVLDMPYQGGDLALSVILPKDPSGLPGLEKKLAAGAFEELVGVAKPALVEVSLPKFKVEPHEPVRLKETFRSLGMALPFTDDADFSRMTNHGQALKVSDAFHKAFVAVDEEGTEAAAATAVVMMPEMATAVPPKAIQFHADHPFVFAIRDVRTNLVLFLGRVTDPSA